MPTKPNMRMGGVDTQGDRGVMGAAMQAAQIKAGAAKDSGLSAVAGQLSDWADDKMQEDRRIALEKRADVRSIAKEGKVAERQEGVLEQAQIREDLLTKEKRAYDKPLREAQIRQADAATRKSERLTASEQKERLDKVQTLEPSEIREEKAIRKTTLDEGIKELQAKKDEWFNDDEEAAYQAEIDKLKLDYKNDLKYLDSFKSEKARRSYLGGTQTGTPSAGGLTPAQKKRQAELRARQGK